MNFKQIAAPRVVKAGYLSISETLGAISLLPLVTATAPATLLQQLMLDNWTPAILVDAANGAEHPIPPSFWQSTSSDKAFQSLMIEAPVGSSGVPRAGWIVFRAQLVRRALSPLLKGPELPPEAAALLSDPAYKHVVSIGIQQAQEAAFDEAVKRWRQAGQAAPAIEKTIFTAQVESPAERIARQSVMQERSKSLGQLPCSPADLADAEVIVRHPKVIDGKAARIETESDEPRKPVPAVARLVSARSDPRKGARAPYMKYFDEYTRTTGVLEASSKEQWANFQKWLKQRDAAAYESCKTYQRATQFEDAVKRWFKTKDQ